MAYNSFNMELREEETTTRVAAKIAAGQHPQGHADRNSKAANPP
jgi:hypothetical protein